MLTSLSRDVIGSIIFSAVIGGITFSAVMLSWQWVRVTYYNIWILAFCYSQDKYIKMQYNVGHPLFRIPKGSILLTSGLYSINYTNNIMNIEGNNRPWNWLHKHRIIAQGHNCFDKSTIYSNGNLLYKFKRKLIKIAEFMYVVNSKFNPAKFSYSKYTFIEDFTKYTVEFVFMLEQLEEGVKCDDIINLMLGSLHDKKNLFRKVIVDAINTGCIIKVSNIKSQKGIFDTLPYDSDSHFNLTFTAKQIYPLVIKSTTKPSCD
jgi:hypothetical protein